MSKEMLKRNKLNMEDIFAKNLLIKKISQINTLECCTYKLKSKKIMTKIKLMMY
jgi:hypothetical protein